MTKQAKLSPEQAFQATFERIRDELIESIPTDLPEVREWLSDIIDYNLPHGKRNRGLYLAHCYRLLQPNASEEQHERARILGWCVEILQAFFLVHDDMMDGSITRRGLPCWYRKVKTITLIDYNHKILICLFILAGSRNHCNQRWNIFRITYLSVDGTPF